MWSNRTHARGASKRIARGAIALILPGMLLAGCDKASDLLEAESRPEVEIRGQLSVLMGMGSFDPNQGRSVSSQDVIVQYKPGHDAIIYTSSDTKFVNLDHEGKVTTYVSGGNYVVRGYDAKPVAEERADGSRYITVPSGVDRWIDAMHVELIDE